MSEVRLGDVLVRVRRPLEAGSATFYRQIGIRSHGRGIFHKESVTGADLGNKRVYLIEPGDLVLNIVFAWEGAVAVAEASELGMCGSHRFPTFRPVDNRCDVRYIREMLLSPAGLTILGLASPGSAGRNRTLSVSALLDARIDLPYLAAQRRIIDLVGAAGTMVASALDVKRRAAVARSTMRESLIAGGGAPRARVAELVSRIDGGRSPLTSGRLAGPGERGVLKLSAVKAGRFVASEVKALDRQTIMPSSAIVRLGDVLITRSNTLETVGAVCYVDDVRPDTYLSDLTLRLHVDERLVDSRYLVEALLTIDARGQITGACRGTSGSMRKISRGLINDFTVPVPPGLEEQYRVVELLDSFKAVERRAEDVSEVCSAARAALLGDLIAGNREIPDSYDALLVAS